MREFTHRLRDLLVGSSIPSFTLSERRITVTSSSNGARMQGSGTLSRSHSPAELISKAGASLGACSRNLIPRKLAPSLSPSRVEAGGVLPLSRKYISTSRRGAHDATEDPYYASVVERMTFTRRTLLLICAMTPTAIGSGGVGDSNDDAINFPRFGVSICVFDPA